MIAALLILVSTVMGWAQPPARVYLVSHFTKTARCTGLMGQVVDNDGRELELQCFVLPFVDKNSDEGASAMNKALGDFNSTIQTEFPWVYRLILQGVRVLQVTVVQPVVNS